LVPNRVVGLDSHAREQVLLEYWQHVCGNREVFLLNHAPLVGTFHDLLTRFFRSCEVVSSARDEEGRSHVGLLWFTTLIERQAVLAFSAFMSIQAFVGWALFRPGLEAFLMVGRWVDDPAEAEIWRNRDVDRRAYFRAFSRDSLAASSLRDAAALADVLGRINDRFLHPNPDFSDRGRMGEVTSETLTMAFSFFDLDKREHQAHCLAFLSLFEVIVSNLETLLFADLGFASDQSLGHRDVPRRLATVAVSLRGHDAAYGAILDELGIWPTQEPAGAV